MKYIRLIFLATLSVAAVSLQAEMVIEKLVAGFPLSLHKDTKITMSSNNSGEYHLRATIEKECKDVIEFYAEKLSKKSISFKKEVIGSMGILESKKGTKPKVVVTCAEGIEKRGSKQTVISSIIMNWK